ncbi:MAG TPA: hypothetical protein PLU43_07590 [Lachnospiraceae bacterium]|nr:hypothetical protein [Lachnospiraceae bacterium]
MQTLNVFEKGFGYLEACLAFYSENCIYFLLYIAAIAVIVLKGTKKEKQIFVPGAVLLLLTVYNPAAPVVLDKIFDVNSEYYRFFWIAPIIVLLPYMAAKLIMSGENKGQKAVIALLLAAICVLGGNFLYENGYVSAANQYKMPEEMIQISELIHEDTAVEYPKAFLEYEYNMQMRQYDPKMLLTIDREDYLYAVSSPSYTDEMIADDKNPQFRLLAALVRYQQVDSDAFLAALDATGTEYVVLSADNPMAVYLKKAGLTVIGSTATHTIYKYKLKDPTVFELVDYSVVY